MKAYELTFMYWGGWVRPVNLKGGDIYSSAPVFNLFIPLKSKDDRDPAFGFGNEKNQLSLQCFEIGDIEAEKYPNPSLTQQ